MSEAQYLYSITLKCVSPKGGNHWLLYACDKPYSAMLEAMKSNDPINGRKLEFTRERDGARRIRNAVPFGISGDQIATIQPGTFVKRKDADGEYTAAVINHEDGRRETAA